MGVIFDRIGKSQTLSQEIEEKIEVSIRDKKFLPGEKLPTEKELCEMFGVSRTALREALQMLSARGLIKVKKGSGIFVDDFSAKHAIKPLTLFLELNLDKDYILHVVQVRKMLEPPISRLAALSRTEEDLELLEKNIEAFIKCKTGNYAEEGQLDREFHLIIAKATGNPVIPIIIDPIYRLMPKIRALVYAEIDKAKSSALEYHKLIVEKIRNQDEDGAFEAMREHIRIAEEHSHMITAEL